METEGDGRDAQMEKLKKVLEYMENHSKKDAEDGQKDDVGIKKQNGEDKLAENKDIKNVIEVKKK